MNENFVFIFAVIVFFYTTGRLAGISGIFANAFLTPEPLPPKNEPRNPLILLTPHSSLFVHPVIPSLIARAKLVIIATGGKKQD